MSICLNDQQEIAVTHRDGPAAVISVPGSGKTRVLVERTIRLIESGVDPSKILCITFTNKASSEMKERITARLGEKSSSIFIGTFHSLCSAILRKTASRIGYGENFTIIDPEDQKQYITKIIGTFGKSIKEDNIDIGFIIKNINDFRENYESEDDLINERFKNESFYGKVALEYFKEIKDNNSIDLTGLLYETVKLLENDHIIREKLQKKWDYIQVDEVQDTNYIQFKMVNIIGDLKKNIFIVGDPAQSVYRFRGARFKNITDFINLHSNCRQINLTKNYRSTKKIVKASDSLIKKNSNHTNVLFETDNEIGNDIVCYNLENSEIEAEYVAKRIRGLIDTGTDPKQIAILYRVNKLSMEMQIALAKEGISFTVIGGYSFFDKREIKDCLAMLKFLSNKSDLLSFTRAALICDGIGEVTVGDIINLSKQNNIPIIDLCKKISMYSQKVKTQKLAAFILDVFDFDYSSVHAGNALAHMISKSNYDKFLDSNYKGDAFERKDNVKEFVVNACTFGETKSPRIEKYLQNIALATSSDKSADESCVSLMTMHASKGLEFENVFIIGAEQDLIPHKMALSDSKNTQESIEEERRLMYVAMTRAKKGLNITYCTYRKERNYQGYLQSKKVKPSPFLLDADLLKKEDYEKIILSAS